MTPINPDVTSTATLVEQAKHVLSASPRGLGSQMLLNLLMTGDGIMDQVAACTASNIGKHPTTSKALAALKRSPGVKYDAVRDTYTFKGTVKSPKAVERQFAATVTPIERRRCKACRAFLRASNGDELCAPCDDAARARVIRLAELNPKVVKRDFFWTREEIIEAMREWADWKGRQPRPTEWNYAPKPGEPRRPSRKTVTDHFPTFEAAILAAGLRKEPAWIVRRREAILNALPATIGDVAQVIGTSRHNARKSLMRLVDRGLIVRIDRGEEAALFDRVARLEEAA